MTSEAKRKKNQKKKLKQKQKKLTDNEYSSVINPDSTLNICIDANIDIHEAANEAVHDLVFSGEHSSLINNDSLNTFIGNEHPDELHLTGNLPVPILEPLESINSPIIDTEFGVPVALPKTFPTEEELQTNNIEEMVPSENVQQGTMYIDQLIIGNVDEAFIKMVGNLKITDQKHEPDVIDHSKKIINFENVPITSKTLALELVEDRKYEDTYFFQEKLHNDEFPDSNKKIEITDVVTVSESAEVNHKEIDNVSGYLSDVPVQVTEGRTGAIDSGEENIQKFQDHIAKHSNENSEKLEQLTENIQVTQSDFELRIAECTDSSDLLEASNIPKSAQNQENNSTSEAYIVDLNHQKDEAKFSFLSDDDDLLDEDDDLLESQDIRNNDQDVDIISDSDSFLDSDEELNLQIPATENKSYENSNNNLSNINDQLALSHKATYTQSKYAPQAVPQQLSGATSTLPKPITSLEPQLHLTGIVPPQPFKNTIPTSQPSTGTNSLVAKKLDKEKKKSDAYDFPMHLVAKDLQKGHAKPVPVPLPAGLFNSHDNFNIPINRTSSESNSHNNNYQRQHPGCPTKIPYMDVSRNPEIGPSYLPSNPYAILPVARANSISHNAQSSINGIVVPKIELPSQNVPTTAGYPVQTNFINNNSIRRVSNVIAGGNTPPIVPNNNQFQLHPYEPVANGINDFGGNKYSPANINEHNPANLVSTSNKTFSQPMNNTGSMGLSNFPNQETSIRGHTRSGSSIYKPNQSEHAVRYTPNGNIQNINPNTPSYPIALNNRSQPLGGSNIINTLPPIGNTLERPTKYSNNSQIEPPVDNQSLLNRQFPIFNWNSSNKIVYAIPSDISQSTFMMSAAPSINVVNYSSISEPNELLKAFPGPLNRGKPKNNDVIKWIDDVIKDISTDNSTLEITIFKLLKLKLLEETTLKDIASILYNSASQSNFQTQSQFESKPVHNAHKLDAKSQGKALIYLQNGNQDAVLQLALEKKDYSMSLLVSSMIGKEKWSEVIQTYIKGEFTDDSSNLNSSSNLVHLIFQVFVGNAKPMVKEFYTDDNKGAWALKNWNLILSTILNNVVAPSNDVKSVNNFGKNALQIPSMVFEFLVDFGAFLGNRQLILPSHIIFIICNIPLSSSNTILGVSAKFNCIGEVTTPQSIVWSEIYEFAYSDDPKFKYFIDLLPQKLFHAYCLHEQELTPLCSKYTDHITGILKTIPKRDPIYINISAHVNDLSTRMMNASNGWLGKPKLSSVWDHLDKSFNKFIGGDDDLLVNDATERKIFDGFTPVSSVNSSLLDLSQSQFTQYQNPLHKMTQNQVDGSNISEHSLNQSRVSPLRHNPLLNEMYANNMGGNSFQPTKIDQILNNSPHKFIYTTKPAPIKQNALRRVQTEQYLPPQPLAIDDIYGEPLQKEASLRQPSSDDGNKSDGTVLQPTVSQLPNNSSISTDNSPKIGKLENLNQGVTSSNIELSTAAVKRAISKQSPEGRVNLSMVEKIYSSSSSNDEVENTNKLLTVMENMDSIPGNLEDITIKLINSNENKYAPIQGQVYDANNEVRTNVSTTHLSPVENNLIMDNAQRFRTQARSSSYIPPNAAVRESTCNVNVQHAPNSKNHEDMNIYSYSKFNNSDNLNSSNNNPTLFEGNGIDGKLSDDKYTSPTANNKIYNNVIVSSSEGDGASDDTSKTALRRFDPIRKSEPLTKAMFDPVIKVSSNLNFRSFSTIPPENNTVDYNDIVEDESDDEEDEEERKHEMETREAEEKKREMELKAQNQKQEEERRGSEDREKTNQDKGPGWFGWLKKDPNEKKPIKAKLGHKTNFYYDESLKRWVNKDSSEEENLKLSSPPPPPPVVRKKNIEPKTKPRSGSTISMNNTGDRVNILPLVPENNFQSSNFNDSQFSISSNQPVKKEKSIVITPGISLTGKSLNGLDDLINLSGGTTSTRRKKKAGRGYVNVMESNT